MRNYGKWSSIEVKKNMGAQMELVSSVDENPLITVKIDGTILNSNTASEPLLNEWRIGVGNKLISNIVDFIHEVVSRNSPEKTEIKVRNRTYQVIFSPLPEQELVSISGFDVSEQKEMDTIDRKLIEDELFNANKKIQEQSEELQELNEDLQTHNEELKVQIEELQTQSEDIRNANEELWINKQWLQSIIDGSTDIISVKDILGRYMLINKQLEEQRGMTCEEIKGKNDYDIYSPEWAEYYRNHDLIVFETGISDQIEEIAQLNNGVNFFLANRFLLYDSMSKPYALCCISKNITERKQSEEELKKAHNTLEAKVIERTEELEKANKFLQEIDIVRKQEIHHRIKNNLQVISSLIDLQAEKFRGKKTIEESQVLEAFKESQDRVISMALIHEELHKGREIDTINFSAYIKELANNLILSYRLGNEDTSLYMDIEENIFFDMDTAVPLGIIINELVSNSLKHAFSNKDNGEIRIRLHREKRECKIECNKSTNYVLSVSDNGVGIPDNLDIEDLDSLGLQLVTTLVDQLDGELELRRDNGTGFIIRFSAAEN